MRTRPTVEFWSLHANEALPCLAAQLWSLLYACIGAAAFVVWTEGGFTAQQGPLTLLGINMVLNLAWMPVRP